MQRVSVVLPNRNHAVELKTSLSSLVGQTRPFDEIILVDDASADDSLSVMEDYAARHNQIKILRNSTHLGVAETVNRGVAAAGGTYLVLASADERVAPEMCETLLAAASSYPDARLIVSQYSDWDAETGVETTHDDLSPLGMWFVHGETPRCFSAQKFSELQRQRFVWMSINSALFDRQTFIDVGGLDPALRWHGDWFATYAIASRHGFCAVPKSLAWFRLAEESYSARGMRDRDAQRAVMEAMLAKFREPENADLYEALEAAPSALSPFVRSLVPVLAARPGYYSLLWRLSRWWFGEMMRGRRPGLLVRMLQRIRT